MTQTPAGAGAPPGAPPIAVIVSSYNRSVTGPLLEGARSAYLAAGGDEGELAVIEVAGSFELAHMAGVVARQGLWKGVVCLGCIIKGETRHDEHIAHAVAGSLAELAVRSGTPIGFGVITAETPEQAHARAGGDKGNKGVEAMRAVLESCRALEAVRSAAGAQQTGARHAVSGDGADKARGNG